MHKMILKDLGAVMAHLPYSFVYEGQEYRGVFERESEILYDNGVSGYEPTLLTLATLHIPLKSQILIENQAYIVHKIKLEDEYMKRLFLKKI